MDSIEKALRKKSLEILENNVFVGKNGGYTAASGKMHVWWDNSYRFLYPFQWLWDTFFIAGWNPDLDQSREDILKFLNSQREDGFLGHIRYNREILKNKDYFPPPDIYYYKEGGLPHKGEIFSKISQPPNVGYGIWEFAKKLKKAQRRKFLEEVFPKAFHYSEYLANKLRRDGLVIVIHPWAAGDDNSPRWDAIYENIESNSGLHESLRKWLGRLGIKYERVDVKLIHESQRPTDPHYDIYLYLIWLYGQWGWDEAKILSESPFRVADPLTNSIWIRSCDLLAQIAEELGKNEEKEKLKIWSKEAVSGLEKLWDPEMGLYLTKDLASGDLVRVGTVSGLMPVFSHKIPTKRARRLASQIRKMIKADTLAHLVPSTFFAEINKFSPVRYWRGPVWIIVNLLLAEGFIKYGEKEIAARLKDDSLKLVYRSLRSNSYECFYEYYNPWTGEGLGSPNQSWTAAAILKFLEI